MDDIEDVIGLFTLNESADKEDEAPGVVDRDAELLDSTLFSDVYEDALLSKVLDGDTTLS